MAESDRNSASNSGEETSLLNDMGRLAEALADEQKSKVSATGHGIAGAFRQAAGTLEEGYLSTAAGYANHAADRIDAWSSGLRRQSLNDMVNEVESFARREPAIFVAGAVAAGFLLGRFLSASAENKARAEKASSPSYAAGSSGSLA